MKPRFSLSVTVLLIAILLSACGPSEEELSATATADAAAVFATQTAEAPTSTPTPEPTATPTPTNTPAPVAAELPVAASELAAALPTLEDLPQGFQELPAGLMDSQLGEGTLQSMGPAAMFMNIASSELAMTILTPMGSDFERSLFEQQMADPESLANMMGLGMQMGGAGEGEVDYDEFEVDGVGEAATGIQARIGQEGMAFIIDIILFSRDDVGAVVGVMHSEGVESQVDIIDLAETVDGRLMALSE